MRYSRLPEDHPLQGYEVSTNADCVAEVPERVLNDLLLYYGGEEPEGEPVPRGRELA